MYNDASANLIVGYPPKIGCIKAHFSFTFTQNRTLNWSLGRGWYQVANGLTENGYAVDYFSSSVQEKVNRIMKLMIFA